MPHSLNLIPFQREDCISILQAKEKLSWSVKSFCLPEMWNYTMGEDIVFAVLDSGVDLDHPDLKNNLVNGKNFVEMNQHPFDHILGHGTGCTGIFVAEHNDFGTAGICPKSKVMPIRVLDDEGNGKMSIISAGIRYAADNGADFISLSLGSPLPLPMIRKAIQYAHSKGVITFAAAGNSGITTDVFYPASYPEVISVGAVTKELRRADFSNTGKNLDFMAPGVDIYSTVPKSWYATLTGTSLAQPFVCAVAGLLKSYHKRRPDFPLKTVKDYRALLSKFTIPVVDVDMKHYRIQQGHGILDPRKITEFLKGH